MTKHPTVVVRVPGEGDELWLSMTQAKALIKRLERGIAKAKAKKKGVAPKLEGTAQAYLENGLIKISVSVKDLPRIIKDSTDYGYLPLFAELGTSITDVNRFAKDVVYALNEEKEDGTTPVHELFDDAFERAVENGSQGVSWIK